MIVKMVPSFCKVFIAFLDLYYVFLPVGFFLNM